MKYFRMLSIICLWVLLLSGCARDPEPQPTTEPADPQRYLNILTQAIAAAENADDRILNIIVSESRQIGSQNFLTTSTQTLSCQDLTGKPSICLQEEVSYGSYHVQSTRSFQNRRASYHVNGQNFHTSMSADRFLETLIPPVLFDPQQYKEVTAQHQGENTRLFFRNADRPESWVVSGQQIQTESASAEALLRPDGTLAETVYRTVYQNGSVRITLEVTCQITLPQDLDLRGQMPAIPVDSIKLPDLQIPELLLRAAADLYAAESIRSSTEEVIDSAAIKTRRTQKIDLLRQGTGPLLDVDIQYTVELSDYAGNLTGSVTKESYREGIFTTVTDSNSETSSKLSCDAMETYCEDLLLMSMFAISHLEDAELSYADGLCQIRFTGTQDMTQTLCQNIYQLLNVDLDALDSEHTGEPVSGYLTIDLLTGLPSVAGMALQRTHNINGAAQPLSYTLHQSYSFT